MTANLPFVNEPLLELRRGTVRDSLLSALRACHEQLPIITPVEIAGDRRRGSGIISTDPGQPERIVAVAAVASDSDVAEAVDAATWAGRDWGMTTASARANLLHDAAEWLRCRREHLTALVLTECAKPWGEADAEVCEAIDFIEYYAQAAIDIAQPVRMVCPPGERNEMRYYGRGVVGVISPWNFPLAIPTGMVAAGLATGNSVLLKPAEQAPGCARLLADAFRAAGFPEGVFALLPGAAETGRAIVSHPGVHIVAFTGSGEVGREILRVAADVDRDARHLKRVVAEMGGKNCVIVDSDADIDALIPALVTSAFAYAGQKCSAASRVMVHEAIGEQVFRRIAGAINLLVVGAASDFATAVPALIDEAAQVRVNTYRTLAARDGRILAEQTDIPDTGWFASPTISTELPDASPILREEIFGPLLAVETVGSVDEACDRVDALPFALTGGLFTRNPHTVERVARRSPVGNLYVNRPITGAMVARHPFGGNRLSGTGTKAGGPGYVLHFVEPRVLSENTVRHGLVV